MIGPKEVQQLRRQGLSEIFWSVLGDGGASQSR
jgi:hypothetical protein